MTRAFIAEYGGLGANSDNVAAFGTSCMYDNQGNLYVNGTASYGNNSLGSPNGNTGTDYTDNLMLKYSPDGSLLFHKTMWDKNNQNCGSTSVASQFVIANSDGTPWIVWLANDWANGGCYYGLKDLNGNIGFSGMAQSNAGISQTSPTDIAANTYGKAGITTAFNYTNPDAPNDTANIPTIISFPNIFSTGTPGWTVGLKSLNTDSTLSPGVFNAVIVDNSNYTYTIGNLTIDGVQHSYLVGLAPDGSVIWQYFLDANTNGSNGVYGETLSLSPDGYLYTIVNDTSSQNCYIDKWSGIGIGSLTNVWRTTINVVLGSEMFGYDINFDSSGNPIVSGILAYGHYSGDAYGIPGIIKLNKSTGSLIFFNAIVTGLSGTNEVISDGSDGFDPYVGHRCGAVYQDRFAFSCTSFSDISGGGSTYPNVLIVQVPTDGSLAVEFNPGGGSPPSAPYINITAAVSSSFSTGTFSPIPTMFATVDLTSTLNGYYSPAMAQTNATDINVYTSYAITLGNFGGGQLTVRPGGTIRPGARLQAAADPNPATNVGGIDISILSGVVGGTVYPAVEVSSITGNSTANSQWTLLSSPLGAVPDGFSFINTTFTTVDTSAVTVSNGGTTVTAQSNVYDRTAITGFPIPAGTKAMFGATLDVFNGYNDNDAIGITSASTAEVQDNYLGDYPTSIGIFDDGYVWTVAYNNANTPVRYFPNGRFGSNGAIVEVAVDMVNYKMWYRINGGSWNPRNQPSFTISSSDFTNTNYGGSITPNSNLGFNNAGVNGPGWDFYQIGLSANNGGNPSKSAEILNYYQSNGINTNSNAYLFNVTWASGSTTVSTVAIVQFYYTDSNNTYMNIGLVDSNANQNWQTNYHAYYTASDGIPSLAGTFNFPATFSLIRPVIVDGQNWC